MLVLCLTVAQGLEHGLESNPVDSTEHGRGGHSTEHGRGTGSTYDNKVKLLTHENFHHLLCFDKIHPEANHCCCTYCI